MSLKPSERSALTARLDLLFVHFLMTFSSVTGGEPHGRCSPVSLAALVHAPLERYGPAQRSSLPRSAAERRTSVSPACVSSKRAKVVSLLLCSFLLSRLVRCLPHRKCHRVAFSLMPDSPLLESPSLS